MIMGACQNSPKRPYIYLGAFRQKPKYHLNGRPSSIFFYVAIKVHIFYVGAKNIGRVGALPIFFIHVYQPPKGA